jgi:hypothetical protein
VLYFDWSQRFTRQQWLNVSNKIGGWLKCGCRVSENDAVAGEAFIGYYVGQDKWRLSDYAASRPVRLLQWHTHGTHAKRSNGWLPGEIHLPYSLNTGSAFPARQRFRNGIFQAIKTFDSTVVLALLRLESIFGSWLASGSLYAAPIPSDGFTL